MGEGRIRIAPEPGVSPIRTVSPRTPGISWGTLLLPTFLAMCCWASTSDSPPAEPLDQPLFEIEGRWSTTYLPGFESESVLITRNRGDAEHEYSLVFSYRSDVRRSLYDPGDYYYRGADLDGESRLVLFGPHPRKQFSLLRLERGDEDLLVPEPNPGSYERRERILTVFRRSPKITRWSRQGDQAPAPYSPPPLLRDVNQDEAQRQFSEQQWVVEKQWGRDALQRRYVTVDPDSLAAVVASGSRATIPLNLFDDATYTAVLEYDVAEKARLQEWRGVIQGEDGSQVYITHTTQRGVGDTPAFYWATFRAGGRHFGLRHVTTVPGLYAVEEFDASLPVGSSELCPARRSHQVLVRVASLPRIR